MTSRKKQLFWLAYGIGVGVPGVLMFCIGVTVLVKILLYVVRT